MLGLNELIAANERAFRAARAAARRPIQNGHRFRIVAAPGSADLRVYRLQPPVLRAQTTTDHGTLTDLVPDESTQRLADAISAAPVLRITRASQNEGCAFRSARFDVDREAGFARWRGTVTYEVARGFAAQVGVSREVFDSCFSIPRAVLS